MARPENPVSGTGPGPDLARLLRRLRVQARTPAYRALARTAGFSASTLAAAASGRLLPSLDVALAFGGACGGSRIDLDEIKRLHGLAVGDEEKAERRWRLDRRTERAASDARGVMVPPAARKRRPAGQPAPDPEGTPAQFVRQLRALRVWAGEPSVYEIRRQAQRNRLESPPRGTIYDALSPRRTTLPRLGIVQVIVIACSGPVDEWSDAWRAIRFRELDKEEAEAQCARAAHAGESGE